MRINPSIQPVSERLIAPEQFSQLSSGSKIDPGYFHGINNAQHFPPFIFILLHNLTMKALIMHAVSVI
jgi:hypothetical protein